MLPEHRILLEDEPCPISAETLGEMYRVKAHGLHELVETIPATARAMLAVYCYRRAHLASIGLAIAATCEKDDLSAFGGNSGTILFERSREAPVPSSAAMHTSERKKITLAVIPARAPTQP